MLEGFVEDEMAHIRQETRSIKEDDESHDIILRKHELFRGIFYDHQYAAWSSVYLHYERGGEGDIFVSCDPGGTLLEYVWVISSREMTTHLVLLPQA